jgi:hypothetical protein
LCQGSSEGRSPTQRGTGAPFLDVPGPVLQLPPNPRNQPRPKRGKMEEGENEAGLNRRPTPVRMAMEPDESAGEQRGGEVRAFQDPGTGEEWIARVSGRSMSGVVPLRVIPLMEVDFFRADEAATPSRRGLRQGESLDDLDEDGLLRFFHASGPYLPPSEERPAPEARGGRQRSRRKG